MRLKSVPREIAKRWKRQQKENGYCPHYQKVGRVLMEVRFLAHQPRESWAVINLMTGCCLYFRKNGTPLNGARGRLVGPIVYRRRIFKWSST